MKPVVVHFVPWSVMDELPATPWQRLCRRIYKRFTPRFAHCFLVSDHFEYDLNVNGFEVYRRGDNPLYDNRRTAKVMASSISPTPTSEVIRYGRRSPRPRWLTFALAYLGLPFENCATWIGELAGVGRTRTPDQLHDRLTARERAREETRSGRAAT